MKGTLFSADFIEDSSGNLRLMELNTDTGVSTNGLDYIDFTEFINTLSELNITQVHTISKSWHSDFVLLLSQSLQANAPFISSFSNSLEEDTTIYPNAIEDTPTKFILRMAYDESAIFDSEYAKNKLGPLELFTDSGDSGSVVEYFISSSTNGVIDYLPNEFNSSNIPDVVCKNLNTNINNGLEFYKIGKSNETPENRYSEFKSNFDENNLLIKFYENPSDTKVKSVRSFNIVYGSNLDVINIGNYISEGLFEKPTSIEFDDTQISNKTNIKHYYELTTTYPKFTNIYNWGGIFEEEQVIKSDGTPVLISSASIGTELKSYFIEGAPNTDIVSEFMAWSYPGSELPFGSYETGSIVVNNIEQELSFNTIFHITTQDGAEFRASGGTHLLIYDIQKDVLRYESVYQIDETKHQLINVTGNPVGIASSVAEILDGDYSSYVIDMETTDTYFLYNGELSVKIVTHNCFPSGTKITLSDGTEKNIEDLTIEDKLLTYNEKTGELSEGTIGNIVKKKEFLLIELTSEDNTVVKSTPLHKFYVVGKGWIPAQDIIKGDILKRKDGSEITIIDRNDIKGDVDVYHIIDVKDNHTYFAEGFLVHNLKYASCFIAGTQITLPNGETKNIEDIVIGDSILTFNETTQTTEPGTVGDLKQHEVENTIKLIFTDNTNITTTSEHPFYVKDKGWVEAGNLVKSDICKKSDGSDLEILEIEGVVGKTMVYNLLDVSENHNFFANEILVHNKI